MQIKQLFEDEDAVSPVIGVILMVAITVILAAVIGTFVLGLGDQVQDNAPQTSLTFDFSESATQGNGCDLTATQSGTAGVLTVTHDGGDKIESANLDVTDGSTTASLPCGGAPTDLTAGNQFDVDTGSGNTVRVVWAASGGGDTSTVGKWNGPDA